MEKIKVQLIFTDAALAAALEELASKRLQVGEPETVEAHSDARTRQLEKP